MTAFCVGLPGWINASFTACLSAHPASTREINSGPLSLHCMTGILSGTRITHRVGRFRSISGDNASWLKSSKWVQMALSDEWPVYAYRLVLKLFSITSFSVRFPGSDQQTWRFSSSGSLIFYIRSFHAVISGMLHLLLLRFIAMIWCSVKQVLRMANSYVGRWLCRRCA